MKKKFMVILMTAALSMTGCSLFGQDTYYIDQGMEKIQNGDYEGALGDFASAEKEAYVSAWYGNGLPAEAEKPASCASAGETTWNVRSGHGLFGIPDEYRRVLPRYPVLWIYC